MADFYGVRATESTAAAAATATAERAVVVFGTAPVHQTGGKANTAIAADSYEQAVAALGWSEDWERYTLCEAMWCFFKLYGVGPVILVNVLDPKGHTRAEEAADYPVIGGQVVLTGDAVPESIVVKAGETSYVRGTDYDVFFEDGRCVIELMAGGAATEETKALSVAFERVDFTLDEMKPAVIGGHAVETGESTGLELVDQVYFRTRLLPDILIAPGFSQDAEVAAVLAAKAKSFSTVFRSFTVCDLSAAKEKEEHAGLRQSKQRVCWPMVVKDGRRYHYSTHLAALMSLLAAQDGSVPSEPASNKALRADGAVLADGREVVMDLARANWLRGQGITTVLNFINGPAAWGEHCACVPGNADAKDRDCNVARMVNYIANTVIVTYWRYADRKMTPRLAESIADKVNIWLNGLTSQEHLAGARCELIAEENPVEDLKAGIVRPHIFLGVPSGAKAIDFIVEYDASYVAALWEEWRG